MPNERCQLTEEEILKAMELCSDISDVFKCKECAYPQKGGCHMGTQVMKDGIALINYKNSEKERLQTERDNLIKTYKECVEEVVEGFIVRLLTQKVRIGGFGDFIRVRDIHKVKKEMIGTEPTTRFKQLQSMSIEEMVEEIRKGCANDACPCSMDCNAVTVDQCRKIIREYLESEV